jgi:hypothetical protein
MSEQEIYLRPLKKFDLSALNSAQEEIKVQLNLGHRIGTVAHGRGGLHLLYAVIVDGQVNFQGYNYNQIPGEERTIDQSISKLESIARKHNLKVVVE